VQNTFFQVQNNQIIIDQAQLTMYAIAAGVVILLLVIVALAAKFRKKNFIKTIPTQLKKGK